MREDWVECTFEEITNSLKRGPFGGDLKKSFFVESGYRVYEQQHAINNDFSLGRYFINEERYEKLKACNVGPDDYIVSCSGTMGKIARLPKDAPKGIINQALLRIRINEKLINSKYFLEFFKSSVFQKKILNDSRGSGMQNMAGIKEIKPIPIYLPPIPIQRAIVVKIEELFSDLDKGIDNLKKAKDQLVIYRHAVLKKAFEGGLTMEWREKNIYSMDNFLKNIKIEKENAIKAKLISKSDYFPVFESKDLTYQIPNQWISLPWKTITSNNKYAMKRGPFGSALKKEYFVDKGIAVYEQSHVINDQPFRHRYFITTKKFEELKAFKAQAGDLLISCSGTLGKICLLPDNADIGIINQALLKIDLDEKIMLKKFFLMLFRSETFQRLIFDKSLGTAMPNMIGMAELKEIPIPIPAIAEQKIIIQEIESRLSVCEKIEQSITESLDKAKALRQSILKKAFEGKLLSAAEIARCKQEQDYEPASELLAKIKAEKKKKK